jgi:uncharacterized protein
MNKPKKNRLSLEFQYDTLIDRENYCNRRPEITTINQMIGRRQKIVLYAPRRFGKTSLMQNVIAADFLKSNRDGFVVMVDFMDVTDLAAIEHRLTQSITYAIRSHAPMRGFFESMARYFKNLALTFEVDPMTGLPSASVKGRAGNEKNTIDEFFIAIKKISEDRPLLLILDEFQDISFLEQAESLMRKCLQGLTKVSTIISGSKRQLLTKMFSSARAPFFGFGDEVSLPPIAIQDWHTYFNERLASVDKKIDLLTLKEICERVHHVPNAISEIGFWLKHDPHVSKSMTSVDVWTSIDRLIRGKEQTYRYHLAPFTVKEKSIIGAIAGKGYVQQLSAKDFLMKVLSNASSVKKTLVKLERLGVVEWELDRGYRLSDPLLAIFVSRD